MNGVHLFLIVVLVLIFFTPVGRLFGFRRGRPALKGPDDLPRWVEIVNANGDVLAVGYRIAWLPASEFGHGASLLLGALHLGGADPALRLIIEEHCKPLVIEGELVLARIVARPGQYEDLIMGPLYDGNMQHRLEPMLPAIAETDVLLEVSSASIGLMDNEDSRTEFLEIWRQYTPASLPPLAVT